MQFFSKSDHNKVGVTVVRSQHVSLILRHILFSYVHVSKLRMLLTTSNGSWPFGNFVMVLALLHNRETSLQRQESISIRRVRWPHSPAFQIAILHGCHLFSLYLPLCAYDLNKEVCTSLWRVSGRRNDRYNGRLVLFLVRVGMNEQERASQAGDSWV